MLTRRGRLDLAATAAHARFDSPPPPALARRAAADPGAVATARQGKKVFAAALLPLPASRLWRAINDEDHHGGRLVDESAVLEGSPRGPRRLLFQSLSRFGVGRFWVVEVTMSGELFDRSGGRLWELAWDDGLDQVDLGRPPLDRIAESSTPVAWSRGAWLLVPMGGDCTWLEYFAWSDPGGVLSGLQWLGAERAVRDAVEAVAEMARGHMGEPHPNARFVRPDGEPLP